VISIVMAVRDGLTWTRRAIDSLTRDRGVARELIVVDNGSAPETRDYLSRTEARVIRNEDNRGCAAAWNQGVAAARGDHVCLVNNDVEVPAGWLDRLAGFHAAHRFAWVSPAIREGPLDYDLDELNQRAWQRFGLRHYQRDEFRGMVLFAHRDLYARMGCFDERFAYAKYEDEDMFWRLRGAGLEAVVMLGVVVHHYGSRTVREQRRQVPGFELSNKRYFDEKWQATRALRKARKVRLAARHLAWRLRGEAPY